MHNCLRLHITELFGLTYLFHDAFGFFRANSRVAGVYVLLGNLFIIGDNLSIRTTIHH